MILRFLLFFFGLFAGRPVFAQTTGSLTYNPGTQQLRTYDGSGWNLIGVSASLGGCTAAEAGQFTYDTSVSKFKFCNASNWIDFSVYETALTCATAGTLEYNSTTKQHRFCNGTNWVISNPTHGYFVLTSGSFNGNLGGLSGANTQCLNDLTANDWKGKSEASARGLLVAGKVRAMLCNASTCQDGIPNKTYYYATSALTTAGGASMTVDAAGLGPIPGATWNGATFFGITANMWTGRAAGTNTAWGGAEGTNHCSNWTDGTGSVTGMRGGTNSASTGKWSSSTTVCNNSQRLYCFVDP